MFTKAMNRLRDFFAWSVDRDQTKPHGNNYLINKRTGDRKVICTDPRPYYLTVDFNWLADTENRAYVVKKNGRPIEYSKERLQDLAAIQKSDARMPGWDKFR